MIYNTAHFWRDTSGMIWRSLSRLVPGGGTTDLSMSQVSTFHDERLQMSAYRKSLAWCQLHRMNITDTVSQ